MTFQRSLAFSTFSEDLLRSCTLQFCPAFCSWHTHTQTYTYFSQYFSRPTFLLVTIYTSPPRFLMCLVPSLSRDSSVSTVTRYRRDDPGSNPGRGEIFCIRPDHSNPRSQQASGRAACLLRSWVRIPLGAWIFVSCECRVLSGRGLCDELFTRPEESYRLCCVVVCDLETSRIGAPYIYIYDISLLRVKIKRGNNNNV